MSLTTYLEAAAKEGRAPFSPNDLIAQQDLEDIDPGSEARGSPEPHFCIFESASTFKLLYVQVLWIYIYIVVMM